MKAIKKRMYSTFVFLEKNRIMKKILMVPAAGLEPARCHHRWILSPLRLPIPSRRQVMHILQNLEKKVNLFFVKRDR